eukprot:TRINITY_DN6259_c0_g1_i1.p1 TRINITY_DN6259_c0_g1~~TRINITY_DN6259_c0_g1_i1.p1  ORF type:complete len:107 (-),score=22.27 TRINITY_DN6259_c0_g1_i1:124-444(-)
MKKGEWIKLVTPQVSEELEDKFPTLSLGDPIKTGSGELLLKDKDEILYQVEHKPNPRHWTNFEVTLTHKSTNSVGSGFGLSPSLASQHAVEDLSWQLARIKFLEWD